MSENVGGITLTQQNTQLITQILSIAGMAASAFGWLTPTQVASLTTNILAAVGPLMTIGGLVWSLLASRKNSIVTEVASLPEVRAVITEPTLAGRDLANSDSTPANVVVGHAPGTPVPPVPAHP